jgi:mono/diheme cytochrome c family protein
MKKLLICTVVFAAIFAACKKDAAIPTVDCTGATPTYTANVKAIFDTNCSFSGCHDSVTKEQGYDLSTYAGSKSASAKKELLGSINRTSGYDPMPKGSPKMSDADIKNITCWVNNGAPQ